LSDVIDGYIARKTNTVSTFGAVLDSIADFILVIVMFILFAPILPWELWQIYWITGIASMRCVSLLVGFIKYHTLSFLHTYANKVTGLMLFCFPFLYYLADLTIAAMIICSIASLSALEELIIGIKSKKLNRDIRGLFIKKA
jgi:CDP-diacylglycerol--glycerol-3-phosphate 3-phosphatidyltransferase